MSELLIQKREPLLILTLNRPEKRNTFSRPMIDGLMQALQEAEGDNSVKAVVITGAGEAFSAGGDVSSMLRGELCEWKLKRYLWEHLQRLSMALEAFDKPTVAAVNGPAAGGGFDLALACDVRTASAQATFISSYVRLGLAPGFGGCYFLPRLVGVGRALEILLSGQEISADEAWRIGIVNRVLPKETFLEDTVSYASELVRWPLPSLKVIKKGVYHGLASDLRTHLDAMSSHDALLSITEEHRELLSRFAKKSS